MISVMRPQTENRACVTFLHWDATMSVAVACLHRHNQPDVRSYE